jgi:thioester reductase-like protein
MTYVVTGATGFIGRHLVARLLDRDDDVYVLVRQSSTDKLSALMDTWGPTAEDRVHPVIGDLAQPRLGLSDDDIAHLKAIGIAHFFHLAAVYDMTADDERNRIANVEGTRHAVQLANAIGAGTFHHTSSIAAAGEYQGLFREDMFEEGQKLTHPYHRTKYESEKIARTQTQMPWRVYRPGIVVGNSETGVMDKIDGPYYFFTAIKMLRHYLPGWFPLVGPELGYTNIVPVDFVADAMDHIAHQPDLDGQAFHLTNPKSQRVGEVMNAFAAAAHAPQMSLRIDSKLLKALPRGTIGMLMALPAAKGVRKAILADFGIPDEIIGHIALTPQFDTRDTERALKGSGIEVPPLAAYATKLWDYWERNLDPDLFKDRSLQGGGHRQDGADHRRLQRHRPRGGDQDRARGRHPVAGGALRRQAPGDPTGDRGSGWYGAQLHRRRLRARFRRRAGQAGAGRPPGGRCPGQQRRPLDPSLGGALL